MNFILQVLWQRKPIVWSKKLQTDEILCLKVTSYPFLILVLYLMSSQGSSDAKHEKKSEPERSQGLLGFVFVCLSA